jgi:hypothetical protein
MYTHFNEPFWKYGQFPLSDSNGTSLQDPWSYTGRDSTPFDQNFYLILNVAVGGTNGWFKDFWDARDQWYPTWQKNGEMRVKSVKMWQQQGYNGC